MILNRKDFDALEMVNNKVLLKPIQDTTRVTLNKTELHIASASTDNSAIVVYEVLKLPSKFVQLPTKMGETIDWIPELELELGDKVWVNRMKVQNTITISCEGVDYLLLPYQFCYLTIRQWIPKVDNCNIIINPDALPNDDNLSPKKAMETFEKTGVLLLKHTREPMVRIENSRHKNVTLPPNVFRKEERVGRYRKITFIRVIMLNGYILFQNVPKPRQSEFALETEMMPFCGIVRFTGSCNISNRYHKWPEANYIHPGNLIHFKHKHRRALEFNLHAMFLDKTQYYLTQRKEILGKIVDREI